MNLPSIIAVASVVPCVSPVRRSSGISTHAEMRGLMDPFGPYGATSDRQRDQCNDGRGDHAHRVGAHAKAEAGSPLSLVSSVGSTIELPRPTTCPGRSHLDLKQE